jgi:hypothetical protein
MDLASRTYPKNERPDINPDHIAVLREEEEVRNRSDQYRENAHNIRDMLLVKFVNIHVLFYRFSS